MMLRCSKRLIVIAVLCFAIASVSAAHVEDDAELDEGMDDVEIEPSLLEVGGDQWWLEKAPWFLPPPPEWGKMPVTMYTSYYHRPVHPHHLDYAHGIPLPDAEALNLARRTYPQPPFEVQAAGGDGGGGDDASFLETSAEVEFTPQDVTEHKSAIGRMRHERVRAHQIQNRRVVSPNNKSSRDSVATGNYGPYDERRASEEAKPFSTSLASALHMERRKRRGTVRAVGLSPAPFCATYPWCKETPPPPEFAHLPPSADPEFARREMARLDPLNNLPEKLEDLKKDPHRFGIVFQHIYESNKHNEKLANKLSN